jgi:hypothetical protein
LECAPWVVELKGWADAVAAVATQCGANEAELVFSSGGDGESDGLWYDVDDYSHPDDYPEHYTDTDREVQWERLRALGTAPTVAEQAALVWPQSEWCWGDRDRIVLAHERLQYLMTLVPGASMRDRLLEFSDPTYTSTWQLMLLEELRGHVNSLWGSPAANLFDELGLYTLAAMRAECPGWRYLTALKGCPKELRMPRGMRAERWLASRTCL